MSVLNSRNHQISHVQVKPEPLDDFCEVLMVKKSMNNVASQVASGAVKVEVGDSSCGNFAAKDENNQSNEVPMAQRLATAMRTSSIPVSQTVAK